MNTTNAIYADGKKAVLYLRVSTEEQVDNFSLDTQEEICRKEAEKRGYTAKMPNDKPWLSGFTAWKTNSDLVVSGTPATDVKFEFWKNYSVLNIFCQIINFSNSGIKSKIISFSVILKAVNV